jgi:hypothetical protein
MATTTNYGWTTPDDTALVKDGASAIRTLGSSVDTTTKALNPSTTLGDIEYRSSTANTNTRLGIGSTGQVLTVAAGVPSWATPAGGGFVGVLVNGSDQNLTNATNTILAWNAEVFDTNTFHDNATNNSRLTVPAGKAGYYQIQANVSFNLDADGERNYSILKNGTAVNYFNWSPGTQYNSMSSSIVVNLAEGDYVQVRAYQSSGGSLTVYGTDYSFFSMNYLGA